MSQRAILIGQSCLARMLILSIGILTVGGVLGKTEPAHAEPSLRVQRDPNPEPGYFEGTTDKDSEKADRKEDVPPPPSRKGPWGVLIALPGGILPGENAEVRRAVDVYLHDFRAEVEEVGPLPGGMRAQVARTLEMARSRALRLAVILYWSAEPTTRELTAIFVDLLRPSAQPLRFTLGWPHQPDSAFYRNLGLKLRSTLLAMVGAPPEPPKKTEAKQVPWHGSHRSVRFGIEAWGAGGLALPTKAFVPGFGGFLSLYLGRFQGGIGAIRTLEERRTYDAAEGDTALTRVCGSIGVRLTSIAWRFGLFSELQGGALHLRTTARLLATGVAHDYGQWIPVLSVGILAGYDMGSFVRIMLGPRLDIFPVRGWLTLMGTRVYDTGRLEPWLDFRIVFIY